MTSGVLRCFYFREKRERGSAHFGSGKEDVRHLLVSTLRRDRRMQWWLAAGVVRHLD
jgi:hypothetical protein